MRQIFTSGRTNDGTLTIMDLAGTWELARAAVSPST